MFTFYFHIYFVCFNVLLSLFYTDKLYLQFLFGVKRNVQTVKCM